MKNQTKIKKCWKGLRKVRKQVPGIVISAGAIISGFVAAWQGFGQWWFGFPVSKWIPIVVAVLLNAIWLAAVCKYLSDRQENVVRLLSWNTLLMITLPTLVLGVLMGYFATRWQLMRKIVILVEPFDRIDQVQDSGTFVQDPEGIAETIKSGLERAIRSELKSLDVRVVLGKRHEKGRSEDIPLDELALKYRADMVISGWYVERIVDSDTEFLVCPKFQVVRVPKPLPEVFRTRSNVYPETITFSRKEIEKFDVNLKLGNLLPYEATLILGAGAYASGDWKMAQHFFTEAIWKAEKLDSPENCLKTNVESSEKVSEAKKKGQSSVKHEQLKGDKALLQLYIGHCLINRGEYERAIIRYDDAVEAGKEILPSDMRYGDILASAYLARGVAYRRVNAFELAGRDFETAGGYLPTSLGPRPLRAEQAKFLSGDREKLLEGAEKYYNRGERYLIQSEHRHAQAYLEMSVEFYRKLLKGMPTTVQDIYSLKLAESLVRLGETHNRLAKPELRDDENTQLAIERLEEAIGLTGRFGNQEDRTMLEIRADALRHLGEAYRAQDKNDEVKKALHYHADANSIWLKLEKLKNTEKQKTKILIKVAGEKTRIGNVYRRLDDLDPDEKHLTNALCAYKEAIRKLGGEEYLKIPYPDSNDNMVDVNEVKDKLETETAKKIIIHHLAHSIGNLAETHIKRSLDESDRQDPNDPNELDEQKIKKDIETACELLDYATRCYRVAVNKLHGEMDPNWIKRIRNEERNLDLRDDLAWCLTLYGYALIKQGPPDPNDPNDYYDRVSRILTQAKRCFDELRDADVEQGHLVFNFFALTVPQLELEQPQVPQQTFLDACNLLRDLTREEKKVWYMDYVCDILDELINRKFHIAEEPKDDEANFENLKNWLKASRVREGRRALDKIIESMQKKLKAGGK